MKRRRGSVRLDGTPVGIIEETEEGYHFTYLPEWLATPGAVPVSLTLPLTPEPITARRLHPFFENLLPEGWLLEIATAKLKIAKDDACGLLLATCADCTGTVEVLPLPEGPNS